MRLVELDEFVLNEVDGRTELTSVESLLANANYTEIEAIPIEWLFEYSLKLREPYRKCIEKVLVDWRKEND